MTMEVGRDSSIMEENTVSKSYHLAIQLIETTTAFLQKTVEFQQQVDSEQNQELIYNDLVEFVHIYKDVKLIIDSIKSINHLIENPEQQQSMMNAAKSAMDSILEGLLKVYDLASSIQLDQQSKNIVDTQIYQLLLKNDKFDVTKSPKAISTTQFLNGFERTANAFASDHQMTIDNVWEEMLTYAIPGNRMEWATHNLFNKNLCWARARHLYMHMYPDHDNVAPTATTEDTITSQQNDDSERQEQVGQTSRETKQAELHQHTKSEYSHNQQQRQVKQKQKAKNLEIQELEKDKLQQSKIPKEQNSQQSKRGKKGNKQLKQQVRRKKQQQVNQQREQQSNSRKKEKKNRNSQGNVNKQPKVTPKKDETKTNTKTVERNTVWYAETLFNLKMKADDHISKYNDTFLRCCRLAQMDMTDNALIRRYVNSLLEVHKSKIQEAITHAKVPIHQLSDMMTLAKNAIQNQEHHA